MKKTPAGWPKPFLHLVYLGVMPVCVHALMTLFFGLEAESSVSMLFMALFASVATGGFLFKLKYDPVVSSLVAGWPSVLAAWKRLHWAMDMPSPGGSAQNIMRSLGWDSPSVPAAVAVLTIVAGLAG